MRMTDPFLRMGSLLQRHAKAVCVDVGKMAVEQEKKLVHKEARRKRNEEGSGGGRERSRRVGSKRSSLSSPPFFSLSLSFLSCSCRMKVNGVSWSWS